MNNENVMRAILGTLVALTILVGCQTARTFQLPTPHIQQQDTPAALIDEPEKQETKAMMDVVYMFRKACLEEKAFWIRHEGKIEQYNCEIVEDDRKTIN